MLLPALSACNNLPSAGPKGFVSGDGTVSEIALDKRQPPVTYDGQDLDGSPLSLADYRGTPVVVVVWGAWCTFCRAESREVQQAADQLKGTARFVGIDLQDPSAATAQAYVRDHGVDYPSFYSPDGDAMLAFHGVLTMRSIPAFVVLDADGRVAGSIMGQLPSVRTLVQIADGVAKEPAGGSADG